MKIPAPILPPNRKRRPVSRGFLILACGLLASLPAQAAEPSSNSFFFHDGDKAMILGDSITQQRMYSTLIESYVLSRFPGWRITFRNTGWGGDTMGLRTRGGIDKGFDRDLKPFQPTAVTIDFGMNDARGGDRAYPDYRSNAQKLVDRFTALGTRITLVTASPEERYQEGQPAGSAYNRMLSKYSDGLREVAQKNNLPFVDQLTPMIGLIEAGRKAGALSAKEGGACLIPGGVHPNWSGHWVMATLILKGLNAPALVSSVEVDASSKEVKAEKAKVTEVKAAGGRVEFNRLDEALPWPVPAEADPALKIPGFRPFDELSRYTLKVTGLSAPKYEVSVDGKSLGTYTGEQLAGGVNLSGPARLALPEVDKLLNAIILKNNLYFSRWREVQVASIPSWISPAAVQEGREAKLKELDAKIAQAEAEIDKLRQPRTHQWVIAPAS